MADDVIIRAEGLGKKYLIGHRAERERYVALRDVLARGAHTAWRKTLDLARRRAIVAGDTVEEFWALKDVSFDVKRGEVLGIVGRNGAGKTTLLKILSRITEPSEGRVTIKGRVASLLEVGTGFHPELSGRENIYLNGAILGMTRAEIRKKFDEIVAFAEVEKFLDTPVKRYSSGMYVRLAFAVAAHLEPEILVVDEVLAVGDAEFQRRCLGKMSEVASGGRTVLFVSHNMAAILRLCGPAVWLADGMIASTGRAAEIIDHYLKAAHNAANGASFTKRNTGRDLHIKAVRLLVDGLPSTTVRAGQPCQFRIDYRLTGDHRDGPVSCSILLFSNGEKLANLWSNCDDRYPGNGQIFPEQGSIICDIPKWPFRNHSIRVDLYSQIGQSVEDWIEDALVFDSHDGDFYGSGVITNPNEGILFVDHKWSILNAGQ